MYVCMYVCALVGCWFFSFPSCCLSMCLYCFVFFFFVFQIQCYMHGISLIAFVCIIIAIYLFVCVWVHCLVACLFGFLCNSCMHVCMYVCILGCVCANISSVTWCHSKPTRFLKKKNSKPDEDVSSFSFTNCWKILPRKHVKLFVPLFYILPYPLLFTISLNYSSIYHSLM